MPARTSKTEREHARAEEKLVPARDQCAYIALRQSIVLTVRKPD